MRLSELATAISTGARVPWDELSASDDDSDESELDQTLKCDGTENVTLAHIPHQTEMEQIMASINGVVTLLLRLSAAIRRPTPHDRWLSSSTADMAVWETVGVKHVTEKFTGISAKLAQRLGAAVATRHG